MVMKPRQLKYIISTKKVLKNFTGVANRQELIAEKGGVKYINDTTATMPEAVIFAIRATRQRFPKSEIVPILGGMNKELYYAALAVELDKTIKQMVLLPGSASEIIEYELSTRNSKIKIIKAVSMEDAVKKAGKLANRGDVVLLSPGATSFNLFKNEFDRGDKFVAQVKKIK
jgi:UDP-N-acetylmuramoylalanine--D-glutamate ligase